MAQIWLPAQVKHLRLVMHEIIITSPNYAFRLIKASTATSTEGRVAK
jgi:hypothetical protein